MSSHERPSASHLERVRAALPARVGHLSAEKPQESATNHVAIELPRADAPADPRPVRARDLAPEQQEKKSTVYKIVAAARNKA